MEKKILTQSLAVMFVVLVFASGLGLFMAQMITKPIAALVKSMQELAEGDGDLKFRLDESKKTGTDLFVVNLQFRFC